MNSISPPQKHCGAPNALPPLPPGLLAQDQYDLEPLPPFPDSVQYNHYSDQIGKDHACHSCPHALPCCHVKAWLWMARLSQGLGG